MDRLRWRAGLEALCAWGLGRRTAGFFAAQTDGLLYDGRPRGTVCMSFLPVPRLLDRPPRWLGGLVAALLALNLTAFKVASPAAGCHAASAGAPMACCAMRPGGCCCKRPGATDGVPAGTPAWCAPGCGEHVAAGLIHPQWEPVLLADATTPPTVTTARIDERVPILSARGPDPPPIPPPQVA